MNILQIHKYYSKKRGGGSVAAFFETKELLESRGHTVMVFSMHDTDNEPSNETEFFAEHFDIREAKNIFQKLALIPRVIYNRDAVKKLDALLQHKKPDVAHVHNIYHYLTPGIFRVLKKHGVPIVFKLSDYHAICPNYSLFAHGTIDDSCKGGKYYKLFFNRSINDSWAESFVAMIEGYVNAWWGFYKTVDIFAAPSNFMRDICISYGIPADKIRILRNVLNFSHYTISDAAKEKIFLYMGRVAPEKGLDVAIDAIAQLERKGQLGEWRLVIAGKGPAERSLKEKVDALRLQEKVIFAGFCKKGSPEWTELMQKASVAVLPSVWWDNSPIAISESMAYATPVVVSDAGGTKEMIEDGISGLVFRTGDVDDCARALSRFIDDAQLVTRMGTAAQQRVYEINNEDRYYTQLIAIYNEAIARSHTTS
jgi:glycosyltransferase involved in cell wall biosynthesis